MSIIRSFANESGGDSNYTFIAIFYTPNQDLK